MGEDSNSFQVELFWVKLVYSVSLTDPLLLGLCSVRSIVTLNLHNYASGRNPWGKPKPQYLEKVPTMKLCVAVFSSMLYALLTSDLYLVLERLCGGAC